MTAHGDLTTRLSDRAKAILKANDRGGYTVPTSIGLYPAQWNWDSCLTALGFATFDEPRAWREIDSLFDHQWPSGMVPHIVFRDDDSSYFPNRSVWRAGKNGETSGITQNPVAAMAVRHLYDHAADRDLAHAMALRLAPKLVQWRLWFDRARDPRGVGLAAVLHPWENFDNSPVWDGPLAATPSGPDVQRLRKDLGFADATERPTARDYGRYIGLLLHYRDLGYAEGAMFDTAPFRVVDVGFNAMLHRSTEDLVHLLEAIGDSEAADGIRPLLHRSAAAFSRLYDPTDRFLYGYDDLTGARLRTPAVSGLLPILAFDDAAERFPGVIDHLEGWMNAAAFALPSFCPTHPDFDPKRYWRGPAWLVVNWLLAEGLRRNQRSDLAERIRQDSARLVERSGFYEYYNPLDGQGLGGPDFTWTASTYLLLEAA